MRADYFPSGLEDFNEVVYIPRRLLIISSGNDLGVDFSDNLESFGNFVTGNRLFLKKNGLMRVVQVSTELVTELQECCSFRNAYFVKLVARQIMCSARAYKMGN